MIAHAGQALAPHDLWRTWNADPLLVAGLLLAAWMYHRGHARPRRRVDAWRARAFAAALLALAIALVSPLEPLSGALASAHMVQHVLLVLVAAPLLAFAAPSSALLRGSPLGIRRMSGRWRRKLRVTSNSLRPLRNPVTAWLLHVAALWFWHAAVPYGTALEHAPLHVVQHSMFLLTALLFWHVVVGGRRFGLVSPGFGVLLVFTMGMQSVLLSLLLTFAREPWYQGYAKSAPVWGLDPLADQQLAGVIMWVPAGQVYLAAALALLVMWLRAGDDAEATAAVARPVSPWHGSSTEMAVTRSAGSDATSGVSRVSERGSR